VVQTSTPTSTGSKGNALAILDLAKVHWNGVFHHDDEACDRALSQINESVQVPTPAQGESSSPASSPWTTSSPVGLIFVQDPDAVCFGNIGNKMDDAQRGCAMAPFGTTSDACTFSSHRNNQVNNRVQGFYIRGHVSSAATKPFVYSHVSLPTSALGFDGSDFGSCQILQNWTEDTSVGANLRSLQAKPMVWRLLIENTPPVEWFTVGCAVESVGATGCLHHEPTFSCLQL